MLTFSSSVEVSPLTSENSTERRREKKQHTKCSHIYTHTQKKFPQDFNINARKVTIEVETEEKERKEF